MTTRMRTYGMGRLQTRRGRVQLIALAESFDFEPPKFLSQISKVAAQISGKFRTKFIIDPLSLEETKLNISVKFKE